MNYKNSFTILGVLAVSLLLSACTVKDKLKNKILDKVDQKVQEERAEDVSPITDDQLLNQIQQDEDSNIDTEFSQLEQDLQ